MLAARARALLATSALTLAAIPMGGCDLFAAFEDDEQLVMLFTAHHATPSTDGTFPSTGMPYSVRQFDNDLGWTVELEVAWVVTEGVQLQTCGGGSHPVTFHFGVLAEDLRGQDLRAENFGSEQLPGGDYCAALVQYAPLEPDTMELSRAVPPELVGRSVYLRGHARKAGVRVPFELASSERIVVPVDLSTLDDGRPLRVDPDAPFPDELTITKTYDRFFDGLDFTALDGVDVTQQLGAALEDHTRATLGRVVPAR